MMTGPNGNPVWLIDHHPMRVFKWTPTFDSYFETPITAVWCNVIAVPIHLFEVSALYAIGSLLGNPIQLDQATVNKTHLSFARICVEIDITKPPIEEVVLDILGKETTLKVKWEKIPLYCRECKHVGHASRNCHALGKNETMARRRQYYNPRQSSYRPKYSAHTTGGANHLASEPKSYREQGKQGAYSHEPRDQHKGNEAKQGAVPDSSGLGDRPKSPTLADFLPEEGFVTQGRRGRKGKQGKNGHSNISRANSADKVLMGNIGSSFLEQNREPPSLTTDNIGRRPQGDGLQPNRTNWSPKIFEKPNYFEHLEQGEFIGSWAEREDEMEEDPGPQEVGECSTRPPDLQTKDAKEAGEAIKQQKERGSTLYLT